MIDARPRRDWGYSRMLGHTDDDAAFAFDFALDAILKVRGAVLIVPEPRRSHAGNVARVVVRSPILAWPRAAVNPTMKFHSPSREKRSRDPLTRGTRAILRKSISKVLSPSSRKPPSRLARRPLCCQTRSPGRCEATAR